MAEHALNLSSEGDEEIKPPPEAPFKITPSVLARFFFHDCDRFLRYTSVHPRHPDAEALPKPVEVTSPVIEAILESGYVWEEEVVERFLPGRAVVPPGDGPLRDRSFSVEETLEQLRDAKPGTFIYQATLRTPEAFYEQMGVDRSRVRFSENRPDLIEVTEDASGQTLLRILDVKRGQTLRITHRIQILLYALQLQSVLEEAQITTVAVDLERGGVWLGGESHYTPCDLEGMRPHVERFLKHHLRRVLGQPPGEASWHITPRCEWCEYLPHCDAQMRETRNISELPNLSPLGKRFLTEQLGIETLPQLLRFLSKKEEADKELARCASLAGMRSHLWAQVQALLTGDVHKQDTSSPALPRRKRTEVDVFISLQQEPLEHTTYLGALLIHPGDDVAESVVAGAGLRKPLILVAENRERTVAVRRALVYRLHQLMTRVHEFNTHQAKSWRDQLALQVYVFSRAERDLLLEMLLEALGEPDSAQAASVLLCHFQGPDLIHTTDHPDEAVPYPVIVLQHALYRMLALPIPVAYNLPEAVSAVGSPFSYARDEAFHYPLTPGLRAEALHRVWEEGAEHELADIRKAGARHVYALRSLFWRLRALVRDQLSVWPRPFALSEAEPYQNTTLSRLAFFMRYESLLRSLQTREMRMGSPDTQITQGNALRFELEDYEGTDLVVRVVGEPPPDVDTMGFYLLVPDTVVGRKAQLDYPDFRLRAAPFRMRPSPHRALVTLEHVLERDARGGVQRVHVKLVRVFKPAGALEHHKRFVLYPIFTDFTSDKVIAFLRSLDERASHSLFLSLVEKPAQSQRPLVLPRAVEEQAHAEAERFALTPSQLTAYRSIRKNRITAVWGPPGTGKTHFLASVICGMAAAHARTGTPCRILVSAFTHAAIENLLSRILERRDALVDFLSGIPRVVKVGHWQGEELDDVVAPERLHKLIATSPFLVVGATAYACLKATKKEKIHFDMVVLDEASQIKVAEAAVPIELVAHDGRLILAGDDLQLPPIVLGEYPEPVEEGLPVLHRSIFEAVRTRAMDHPTLVRTLEENFRMNDVLTSFAATLLYGPSYRCVTPEIAQRRLDFQPTRRLDTLIELCLDPAFPIVFVIIDGLVATRENQLEADIVADMVVALREGLRDLEGKPYRDDAEFFRDGVFVVSPHHSQIRRVQQALAERRDWTSPPFVNTVDKTQGREASAVLVSYGVSDPEYALQEASFIYGLNRLNVAVTRARSKSVVCIPKPLLESSPGVLENEEASRGLAYMRRFVEAAGTRGETVVIPGENDIHIEIRRCDQILGPAPAPRGEVPVASRDPS